MARPTERILGSNAKLVIKLDNNANGDYVVELDKWTAKALDEKKDYKPNGHTLTTNHLIHKGWELSIDTGITNDAKLIMLLLSIYSHNINQSGNFINRRGMNSDQIKIVITHTYIAGATTDFIYNDCLLYDLNVDCGMQNDEIRLTFTACSSDREVSAFGGKVNATAKPEDYILGGVTKRVNASY